MGPMDEHASDRVRGPQVQRAVPTDFAGAAEVIVRSRAASVPAIPLSVHPPDDMRTHFATNVFGQSDTWVAVDGARVTAVMVLVPGWIDHLYVDPDWTDAGIGSRLVEVAKAEQDELTLWTFQSNTGARRFYERHGFVAVEATDGDNEEGAPDVRYLWPPPDVEQTDT